MGKFFRRTFWLRVRASGLGCLQGDLSTTKSRRQQKRRQAFQSSSETRLPPDGIRQVSRNAIPSVRPGPDPRSLSHARRQLFGEQPAAANHDRSRVTRRITPPSATSTPRPGPREPPWASTSCQEWRGFTPVNIFTKAAIGTRLSEDNTPVNTSQAGHLTLDGLQAVHFPAEIAPTEKLTSGWPQILIRWKALICY